MKSLALIVALLCCTLAAHGREVVLVWDASPPSDQVIQYRIYEMTGPGWTQIGVSTTPRFSVGNREPGLYEFAVSAVNFWGESMLSDSATTPGGLPAPPSGPTIEGAKEVALEVSDDLETWRQVAAVTSFSDREFFRVAFVEDQ